MELELLASVVHGGSLNGDVVSTIFVINDIAMPYNGPSIVAEVTLEQDSDTRTTKSGTTKVSID